MCTISMLRVSGTTNLGHLNFKRPENESDRIFIMSLKSRYIGFAAALSLSFYGPFAAAQAPTPAVEMPPLIPEVHCENSKCKVTFTGMFDGQTLRAEALPMAFSVSDTPYWQPRFMSDEALKIDGEDAPYGWLIGEEEEQVELYLTPLTELGMEDSPLLFMVEQRAGFEHVGVAYRFYSVNTEQMRLSTAREFGPSAGPQIRVTAADTQGVRTMSQSYNTETGEFEPVFEQYEWYSGAESMMLGSESEMNAIYAQEDILMNEPVD